jgi:chromosome segregation protein
MQLQSIELSGFKSFAKKSELQFNSPISAIVGPNGSGKSNVAEAFRFVLGEQSIKSMRGKRGEDLIWNGAGSEPRANRASVKVTFDNSNKIFNIDFPQVSIERVVHRDGTNEYSINGSTVRLKDILELLAGAKIGASGHHIISQGEADKILNSNAKDRKAMIEDTLGLRIYQYKRIESERKLKKTFENINQVESLRKEIGPHLKFLKKQVEKIEKTENMRDELISLAKDYFKREDLYINLTRKTLLSERKPLEETLENLVKELNLARKTLEKNAEKEKKDYVVLEVESEIGGVRVHKSSLERELGKLEGSISAEERIIRKERELIASNEHKLIPLKDVEELSNRIELLEVVREIKDAIKQFIKGKHESADTKGIVEAEKILESLKKEKEKLEKALTDASEKEKKLQEQYEDLKKDIEKVKDSSHDAEKAVFRIMSEENEIISKINAIKSKEEKLKYEEENFKKELEEIGHLVGTEVLRFERHEVDHKEVESENRHAQEERKRVLERLKIRLEDAGISGADDLLKEYKEVSERDEFLTRELLDLEKSAETLRELIKSLEERLAEEFSEGLDKINKNFGELFVSMFGGGEAHLTLTKSKKSVEEAILEGEEVDDDADEEVVEEGLEISVNLPRKKIRNLMMLSGGERALTSIALIFAVSQVNPPPFIILDETDAALDESNSKKYGDLVEALSKHSQLILITHNRETMSRAGIIYGVTMSGGGLSKLLSIAFEEAVQVAK